MKADNKRIDELANEYKKHLENLYAQAQEYSETPEERIRYSFEYAENAIYYSLKLVRRIAGFELDYAITTYEILTNNEFDLF